MLAALGTREEFVENCLDLRNLPAVPPYWKRMRKQNQAGPPLLGQLREPPALRAGDFEKVNAAGAVILDCRSPEAFGGAHIPGALNVGAGSSFPTWADTVLPPDRPFPLVMEDVKQLWDICWDLLRIGYDLPQGWLAGGMMAWRTAAKPLATIKQWSIWDCGSGYRSSVSSSLLTARGYKNVANVLGGMSAWKSAAFPTT